MEPLVVISLVVYLSVVLGQSQIIWNATHFTPLSRISFCVVAVATSVVPVVLIINNHVSRGFAWSYVAYLVLFVIHNATSAFLVNLAIHSAVLAMYTFAEQNEPVSLRMCATCSIVHHIFLELITSLETSIKTKH